MKKKILFCAYDLNIGGIEKALINLLNVLDKNKYDITLMLEKKEGVLLSELDNSIKVVEYNVYDSGNPIIRKIKNRLKLWKWVLVNKNKYDFSCSYATYSRIGAHIAVNASKNSNLWIHSNYFKLYNDDQTKLKKFLDSILIRKFKRNIYVSEDSKNDIINNYDGINDKAYVCGNIINYNEIKKLCDEQISIKKVNIPTFINVGRHDDDSKKLYRIFAAIKKLKAENYKFKLLLIGDGIDHKKYQKYVQDNKIDDVIHFMGSKKNPFPYYKLADAVLLSSRYEGFPVVFLEAMTLNLPIISTKVSDWHLLDKKYGIFVNNDDDSMYNGIKKYLDEGFKIKEKFNINEYNSIIIDKLTQFINNR